MVEINNQRKAFLDMLAWSEGTDTWRQKTRNHGYDVIVGGELFTDYSDYPRKLVTLNPNSINRRRTLPASFLLVDALTASSVKPTWKTSSPKSQDAVALQQIKERGALTWLIVVISVRQSTVAAISGLHCRALVMVSSSIRLTAWLKFKEAGGKRSRDWCMSRVTAIISALVICIIVCLSWAVNHYRDNAITYKAQRDKNARELKLANAAITGHADASAWCCCARCKIHEELAMLKLKMMLCDDAAAGRRRLHIASLSVAWSHHTSGVDNAASPDWQTPVERDYFTLRERLITIKQLEGTQKYINEQCR